MQRYPQEGYVLPELALKKCNEDGCRALTGLEFGLERATKNERGSSVWSVDPHVVTSVEYGLHMNKPTLLIKHGGKNNPFNSPEGYEELRAKGYERSKFKLDNGLFHLDCEEGLEQTGPERQIWVIQGEALEKLVSGLVQITQAAEKTALVPMIGGMTNVEGYEIGHKNNIGSQIRIVVDKDATNLVNPLGCPLVFDYDNDLDGFNDYYVNGCVVGVSVGAEGATQKKNETISKGSFLDLLLRQK